MNNSWFVEYVASFFKKFFKYNVSENLTTGDGVILEDYFCFTFLIRNLSIYFLARGNLTMTWFFGKLALGR